MSVRRKYVRTSLKYNQQDATFSRSIYFYKLLHMFQAITPPLIRRTKTVHTASGIVKPILLPAAFVEEMKLRPSSGAQNCTYSVRYCQTSTAACCFRGRDGTPPIIRSTKLYIQRQVLSNQYCCLLLSWMRWNSVHHQEHKTVHTASSIVKPILLPAAIVDKMELRSTSSTITAGSSNGLTIPDAVCTVLCS